VRTCERDSSWLYLDLDQVLLSRILDLTRLAHIEHKVQSNLDIVSVNHHWFKGGKLVVADNLLLQQSVLCMYHDHESTGHPRIFNMYMSVARDYWWPDMKHFVVQYVKGCAVCQSTKPNIVQPKIPMYPIATTGEHAYPFQMISWDLITDLPKRDSFNSILTIVDHNCSKAALFFPCSKEVDATGVATIYA
jgi:Integrase zinc binding domain